MRGACHRLLDREALAYNRFAYKRLAYKRMAYKRMVCERETEILEGDISFCRIYRALLRLARAHHPSVRGWMNYVY
jgi:hypothetical protein